MSFKLDEHVDVRVIPLLKAAGYDVATVPEQELTSAPDSRLIEVCRKEDRCLITADRGFGNRSRYNPAEYSGIVVVRLPNRPNLADWRQAMEVLIAGLEQSEVKGKLWVIQSGKLFEYRMDKAG